MVPESVRPMTVGVLSASSQITKVNRFSHFVVFFHRAISKYEARSIEAVLVGREADMFLSWIVSFPPLLNKLLSSVVENFL